jgi:hypothetical protein
MSADRSAPAVLARNMAELQRIVARLADQDHAMTADPAYVVERRRERCGLDPDYASTVVWVNPEDDYAEADDAKAAELDLLDDLHEPTAPWFRIGKEEWWERVQWCLTREGAEAYIKLNGHNLGETRIYVESGWRNHEWITLRESLPALVELVGVTPGEGFQARVAAWVVSRLGAAHQQNSGTRSLRLVEEAVEFAQALGVPREKVDAVLDIVYSRPPGEPSQELGGVAVTAASAAASLGVSFAHAAVTELARIESLPAEHFQRRNAEKVHA